MTKKVASIRIKTEEKEMLKKKFGGLQAAIDLGLEEVLKKYTFIYLITNLKNKKQYVGISKNPKKRFYQHCHSKTILGYDIKKHGKESFSFEVLAKSENPVTSKDLEIFFIFYFKTGKEFGGYNAIPEGKMYLWDNTVISTLDNLGGK